MLAYAVADSPDSAGKQRITDELYREYADKEDVVVAVLRPIRCLSEDEAKKARRLLQTADCLYLYSDTASSMTEYRSAMRRKIPVVSFLD